MKKLSRYPSVLLGLALAGLMNCGPCSGPDPGNKMFRPRLVVVIVIDQFRYDYLVRFRGLFSGGLAKLINEGALFTNARHRHALTECAPGHAALLTGCHPNQHGIIGDQWYDRARQRLVSAIEDSSHPILALHDSTARSGASPHQMVRATLGDWIKARDSASQVLNIAGQALSATLMAGQHADAAFWFDVTSGGFTSSKFFLPALPHWVEQWNNAKHADRYFGASWEKLLAEADYFLSREDLFAAEADGIHTTFPHALGKAGETAGSDYYQRLAASPFGDLLTLEFAQAAVRANRLGEDEHTDLLCLGLSATHAIGKTYGPLSQEMQDNLIRLDLNLGRFLEELERRLGHEHYLIALASDHGILPMPEELRRRGLEAARVSAAEAQNEIAGALQELQNAPREGGDTSLVEYQHNGLYLTAHAQELQAQIAEQLRTISFLSEVFTAAELASPARDRREYEDLFRHAYFAGRSPEILLRRKPYYLISNRGPYGTASGSVYDYDAHVPLVLWGEGIEPDRYEMPCSTVDLAPTLAHLLELRIPENIDGRVLSWESNGAAK